MEVAGERDSAVRPTPPKGDASSERAPQHAHSNELVAYTWPELARRGTLGYQRHHSLVGEFWVAPAELEKVLLQGLCHGLRELSAQLNGHDYHICVLYLQALCRGCIGNLPVDNGAGTARAARPSKRSSGRTWLHVHSTVWDC